VPSQRALLWLESVGLPAQTGRGCLFDVTVAEMREAAVQGCSFFDLPLRGSAADIPETSFLAGCLVKIESMVKFHVLAQKSEQKPNEASRLPLLAGEEEFFTILADVGMLSISTLKHAEDTLIFIVLIYFSEISAHLLQGIERRQRSFVDL